MAVPQIVLWNSGDVLGGGDSATAGHDDSSYVTEVVLRANRPRAQARLIALREGPSGPEVVGFGVVQSGQPVATGKDRVKVEPLVRIAPLPVARILDHLAAEDARTDVELFTPPALRPRALSPKRGELVLAALTGLSREIAELLLRLQQEQQPIAGDRGQRIREERDAIDLALGMARMEATAEDLNDDVPATGPQEPLVGLLAPEVLYDVEDDLISEDLRRFDQNGELTSYLVVGLRHPCGCKACGCKEVYKANPSGAALLDGARTAGTAVPTVVDKRPRLELQGWQRMFGLAVAVMYQTADVVAGATAVPQRHVQGIQRKVDAHGVVGPPAPGDG
jgi:hypothetical protein